MVHGYFQTMEIEDHQPRSAAKLLRGRWVEAQVLRLRIRLLPGLSSFEAIADRLTEVGRNIAAGGRNDPARSACEDPPEGVTFPPDYSITPRACCLAAARALNRVSKGEAEAYRELYTERIEEWISRLRPKIIDGHVPAINAAMRGTAALARMHGVYQPIKIDVTKGPPPLDPDKYRLMLTRLTHEDRMLLVALLSKARGGPDIDIGFRRIPSAATDASGEGDG
jgi:hypothetical protein